MSINLQFTIYRFYSSCYDLEVYFEKGQDKFKMKQLYNLQQDGTQYLPVNVFLEFPVYEIQSICNPDEYSQYINYCSLIFKILRKGTQDEVAQSKIILETVYNQYSYIRYISWVRVADTEQRLTQFRNSQKYQSIQQPQNNLVITASQYQPLKQDPYYPIKVAFFIDNLPNIQTTVKYDPDSLIYKSFIQQKYIKIKFENYPTLYILKAQVGLTYNINSTEFTQRNSTLITLKDNALSINFQNSFEIVQEILLQDKVVTIKMFLRIKLVLDSYFLIERLPFYDEILPQEKPEDSQALIILKEYYGFLVVFAIVLAFFLVSIFIIKKIQKNQSILKNTGFIRQNSDEENSPYNINVNLQMSQSDEIKI
ncbi:transmembrane protein, putative (macronuclear) [Tetrahymena thermophila SB210]|uniref:Transmembrane protein, putative n=1 Tax=Tetrahymena thermophila (strain SB210) TaxID=312017 RepID=Q22GC9_TETTS|nr:transmembrane protein, putative [Tetrahymena thermophila SB210]EAR84402.2 transmembrane protein, putative [Tetrahymena thermophila SB210]|eukprot:XP_001032065.2 transmembrane protein, putative [Tetrahymena thermophila SB210]